MRHGNGGTWARVWLAVAGAVMAVCVALAAGCATGLPKESGESPIKERATVPTAELRGDLPADAPSDAPVVMEAPEGDALGAAVPEALSPELDYRIGPGDVLEFWCFSDERLSRPDVVVRYDGAISLLQIPDVQVKGLTIEEATDVVRDAYTAVFREPEIALAVRSVGSKVYYVMGDVSRPAEYPYLRKTTILKAINIAGGLRISDRGEREFVPQYGSLTKAFVIRHTDGERNIIECDLRRLTEPGPHPGDTVIFPEDVIYVPEGVNLVYVMGAVSRPSWYELSEGMTLLQVLAQAGGLNESQARQGSVILIREADQQNTEVVLIDVKAMLHGAPDIPMEPGDIIYVPRKQLVRLQEFVGRFTGTISSVLSLYTQAYDAYYTKERFDEIFEDDDGGTSNVLGVLQGLRDFTIAPLLTP